MTLPTNDPRSDADAVIETTMAAVEPAQVNPEQLYSVLVPEGAQQETLDLDRYLPSPRRTKGMVHLHDGHSLAAFVNRYGATSIFADEPGRRVTAVVNGPTQDAPGWGDHRGILVLKHTSEWEKWASKSGVLGSQVTLAELVEDRLMDIIEPDGATMLELAQSFEASSSARFKSGERLASGERQFVYEETVEARAGRRGDLTVPERFTLALAPFVGEQPVTLTARFRFRVNGGDLRIGFIIDRLDDVDREAFDRTVAGIVEDLVPEVPLYAGTAPA